MLNYLIKYGIDNQNNSTDIEDLDVNDRLVLQEQINRTRKNQFKLIKLTDDIQNKILDTQIEIRKLTSDIISNNDGSKTRNDLFNTNDEYLELEAKLDALKSGLNIVNQQIDMCKSDLRILNSVFYNKF